MRRKISKIHFTYFLWVLSVTLLFPWLVLVALYTRKTALRLPDAQGARSGDFFKDSHKTLSITMLGESTIAGVGVEHQAQGLVANTAFYLAELTQCRVQWQALGKNGINIRGTINKLAPQVPPSSDFIVVCLGVNDTTGLTRLATWQSAIEELVGLLQAKSSAKIFFTSIPPIGKFSALPQPLRWVLGLRAQLLEHVLQVHPMRDKQFQLISFGPMLDARFLARDGYHPSAEGYQFWGKNIAAVLAEQSDAQ